MGVFRPTPKHALSLLTAFWPQGSYVHMASTWHKLFVCWNITRSGGRPALLGQLCGQKRFSLLRLAGPAIVKLGVGPTGIFRFLLGMTLAEWLGLQEWFTHLNYLSWPSKEIPFLLQMCLLRACNWLLIQEHLTLLKTHPHFCIRGGDDIIHSC